MKIIEVKELNKNIKGKRILKNINLSLEGGYTYKLLGGNGCGKTTLIKCILGIADYDSGNILKSSGVKKCEISNKEVFKYFSVYFSDTSLPKNLKVCECIRLFKAINEYEGNTDDILNFFQIKSLLNKKIGILSTGEKNITLLITTLLSNWEVLILDEPFIGLDDAMKIKVGEFLRKSKNKNRTIIVVSHEEDDEFVGDNFYDYYIDGNNGFKIVSRSNGVK